VVVRVKDDSKPESSLGRGWSQVPRRYERRYAKIQTDTLLGDIRQVWQLITSSGF